MCKIDIHILIQQRQILLRDSTFLGICNYFHERVTSGLMEGINNKIKLIKRQAYGFTNFDNLRMRLVAAFFD